MVYSDIAEKEFKLQTIARLSDTDGIDFWDRRYHSCSLATVSADLRRSGLTSLESTLHDQTANEVLA